MIKQDNKLIFDIDKKYIAGKSTVWNNVKRKQLLLNKNIVVYAYIKEIEYNTDDIKVKLNSTDNTETIITLDKTSTDNSGILEYTTPDAKTDELNYALTLFVNEAYKDYKDDISIINAVVLNDWETIFDYSDKINQNYIKLQKAKYNDETGELTNIDYSLVITPPVSASKYYTLTTKLNNITMPPSSGSVFANGPASRVSLNAEQLNELFETLPVNTDELHMEFTLTNTVTGAEHVYRAVYNPTTGETTQITNEEGGGQVINTTPTRITFDVDSETTISDDLTLMYISISYEEGKKYLYNEIVEIEILFQDGTTYNTRCITQPPDLTNIGIPSDVLVVGEAEITISYMGNEQYSPSSLTQTTLITEE